MGVIVILFISLMIQAQDFVGNWKLTSMVVGEKKVSIISPITLNISKDSKIGGKGGCNSYGGNYSFEKPNKAKFFDIFSTQMYCDGASETEQIYFNSLQEADNISIKNGELIIQTTEKGSILRFNGENKLQAEQIMLYIKPKMVDCIQVAPKKCLMVKYNEKGNWQRFYDEIEGFEFQKGFYYLLQVERERIINPPKDTSSFKHRLVKIVKKSRKPI